jgi:hypothetical protein
MYILIGILAYIACGILTAVWHCVESLKDFEPDYAHLFFEDRDEQKVIISLLMFGAFAFLITLLVIVIAYAIKILEPVTNVISAKMYPVQKYMKKRKNRFRKWFFNKLYEISQRKR